MITIEELEIIIEQKSNEINEQMAMFQEGIPLLGSVVGKDSTEVYNKLRDRFNDTIELYNTSTRRNVEILTGYVSTLDNILVVLSEVMNALDRVKNSKPDDGVNAKNEANAMLESAASKVDALATDVEEQVEKMTGSDIKGNWFKPALVGGAMYLGLGFLGAGKLISLLAALGSGGYLYMKGNK